MKETRRAALAGIAVWMLATPASADHRNGRRFDPGAEMSARAEAAPVELDLVKGFLGQWDVAVTLFRAEDEPVKATGRSEITFMNRGHALMENFFSQDFDGHELAAITFLGFNPASTRWFLGGADSWRESGWVADGLFEGDALVLSDTRRRGGGIVRFEVRHRLEQPSPNELVVTVDESSDRGGTWRVVERREYRRRPRGEDFLEPKSDFGSPAPGRPAEAAAFDFLIGEWNGSQDMTFANGQRAQWTSRGTAVYALNGSAILEYNWYDVDPNLPDAATTILRLYNRATRRWECLYVPNRGHNILFFGGVKEGADIVLHRFEADSSTPLIPRWVFHDIKEGSYSWYAESSRDRGRTWTKTWLIDATRKQEQPLGAPSPAR